MERDERRVNRIVTLIFVLAALSIIAYALYRDVEYEEKEQQETLAAVRDKWHNSREEDR